MTYEQAVAIVKEVAPNLIIMGDGSKNHVALQKAEGHIPFCISLPDAKHLFVGREAELEDAERITIVNSILQYVVTA